MEQGRLESAPLNQRTVSQTLRKEACDFNRGRNCGRAMAPRAARLASRLTSGMASGQVADYGQQALAADKLLTWSDLCFRVGRKTAGEEWFSGAARRYVGKILEIRHISSCGHGS